MRRNCLALRAAMYSENIKSNSYTLALVTFEERDSLAVETTILALAMFSSTK